MEIKKRLYVQNSQEVNAVLINDEGEEYPVFLESLHNNIIFPTLLESGYKIVSMPYGFMKDGVMLDDLPCEVMNVEGQALEYMYNSIGTKLSYEEINSHIDAREAVGLPIPPTNYTINTREEFIEYLESLEIVSNSEDFYPINYFVSPSARFTIEEYIDKRFSKYVNIICNRRTMSLKKFHKLVAWLQQFGLSPAAKPLDVIEAYFAWGFDGVNLAVMSKRREQRREELAPFINGGKTYRRRTLGFVDRAGNMYTPEDQHDIVWKPLMAQDEFERAIQNIPMGEVSVIPFHATAMQEVVVCDCSNNLTCVFSTDLLKFSRWSQPTLRVESIVGKGTSLSLNMAMPSKVEELVDDCMLHALARDLYNKRRCPYKVSSYDALLASGFTPRTAVEYITRNANIYAKNQNAGSFGLSDEDSGDLPEIGYAVLEDFFAGRSVTDKERSLINDIIDGVISTDQISVGKSRDDNANTESLYQFLYAVHHVFKVPLEEINQKIKSVDSNTHVITFSGKGLNATMSVDPLLGALKGYNNDLNDYLLRRGKQSNYFIYVLRVAREVGVEGADRHVGVEFFMANAIRTDVKNVLNKLAEIYKERVEMSIPNPALREKFLESTNNWCFKAFFEISFKGTYSFPTQLGGGTTSVTPDMRQVCINNTERKIESLNTLCKYMCNMSNKISFNGYCTNAYITPTHVIPRQGVTLKAYPFYTLWYDWRNESPEVWEQLVQNGILEPDFVPWGNRYSSEAFLQRSIAELDQGDSLLAYYNRAVDEVDNCDPSLDFKAVTHPIEYLYPGLYVDEEKEEKLLDIPREGAPVIRLGLVDTLTFEGSNHLRFPKEPAVEVDQYIREFNGFDTDTLMNVPNVLNKLPDGISNLIVYGDYIAPTDSNESYNFRRIAELIAKGYPIIHLYDRKYIFTSTNGKIWEVQV